MKAHETINPLLPFYAAGTLEDIDRQTVENHLAACPQCRSDLALWQSVGGTVNEMNQIIPANPQLATDALLVAQQARRGGSAWVWAARLVLAQIPLMRREIWLASALVFAIGCIMSLLIDRAGVIQLIAPLVAAAGLAVVYGPESDPAIEIALATPTSPRQVLLARLVLVFAYDLALAVAASLVLAAFMPGELLFNIILGWLGPMAFLAMLALALSMWVGASSATIIAYLAWFAQWVMDGMIHQRVLQGVQPVHVALFTAYLRFWQNPLLLLLLSLGLLAAALWLAGKGERCLPRWA